MDAKEPGKLEALWIEYRIWIFLLVGGGVLLGIGSFITQGFINVPEGHAMLLIRKTGKDLPSGEIIAAKAGYKGIQLQLHPEGWHFLNPYTWEAMIKPKIEIPEGMLGVVVRLFGKSLRPGQVIAEDGQKGILAQVLRPGRHTINPYAFSITTYPKTSVPPGHLGVVVLVSGKDPKDPNIFVTQPGERGVQHETIDVGDYYINPYMKRIVPVDVRAHKSELIGKEGGIAFPSKDGFPITMDATIEWYIDRARVAEVYVKYVDDRNSVIKNVINKIILPYARGFSRLQGSNYLAREFIGGLTRQRFQEAFLLGMQKACAGQGIIIRSALVKNVVPPPAIVDPIKKREITVRLRDKFLQQMEREKQQKKLAIEESLQIRARMVKKVQADVAVALTQAEQAKEVALIDAQRSLQYAKLQLQAAENQAQIIMARGKATAKVIDFNNKARAEAIQHSVKAFGSGDAYVRYLYLEKIASNFHYVLSNTSGPFLQIFQELANSHRPTPSTTQAATKQGGK